MSHSLRHGWRFGIFRLPRFTAFCSDGLTILVTVTALISGTSRGEELPQNVVLDFTAVWCGPCQEMSPLVHKLQKQGYAIQKVDVDQQQNLARSFGIKSIPTFVLVVNGQEVERMSGKVSEHQLRQMAQRAMPPRDTRTADNRTTPALPSRMPLPKSPARSEDFESDPPVATGPRGNLGHGTAAAPEKEKKGLFGIPKFAPFGRGKTEVANAGSDPRFHAAGQNPESEMDHEVANPILAASVRLRVTDDNGVNFGSGTIVDSRIGRTLIMTCGHIFKSQTGKFDEKSPLKTVEVDLFPASGQPQTYVGKLIDCDLEADVGVVAINTASPVTATALAPIATSQTIDQELQSVGCGGGEQPGVEAVQVTAINKYDGPDNLECTVAPQQGRSGGGLFDAEGQLVGVCIAADHESRRGLYAALKPIHALLNRASQKPLVTEEKTNAVAESLPESQPSGVKPAVYDATADELKLLDRGSAPSADELAKILGGDQDAEVICIVRPKNGDPNRVVILNEASPKFVTYLLDSLDADRSAPRNTGFRVPK